MKTYLLLFCLLCSYGLGVSQNQASDFIGNKGEQTRNPRNDQMNFVPNEVLVKFKDAIPVAAGARMKVAGISSVDKVLQAHGITSLEKLFLTEQKPQKTRMMKSPQGKDITIPSLDKIFRISVPPAQTPDSIPSNIFQLIEELKAQPEVEYAEPNYIYSVDNMQPVGSVLTAEDVQKLQSNNPNKSKASYLPNDPLYGQQWYIPAVKADLVWDQTTGDTTQVIAILDSGVDWNHPDLKNKIWTNPTPNTTPDANGVVTDIRGWDYINNDNDPMDDNSHGTHVAGIAAAETNNGIGIAGVCPKAKIMPIKVFQSTGKGDVVTITKGINYAAIHGATVINMSFGSYARSLTMEDALANAYATCILVAAAGNDGIDINDNKIPHPIVYPAALSYVLGVQATQSSINDSPNNLFKKNTFLTDFTNYDSDGPTFSTFSNLFNYELRAPGEKIISTIPNGNYRIYQGTSMAAPIVSGAVALYNSVRSKNESNELMWVKLIQSTSNHLDINKAINLVPKAKVQLISQTMVDSIPGDDNDGRVDAGETIQFWFTARNTGGQCDSTWFKLRLHEFEDATTVKIIKPLSFIGSMSPYATRTSQLDPVKIQIAPNVINNRDIVFDLLTWYKNSPDTTIQQVVLNVENGQQLDGVMDTTLILTPNKLWLINSSFRVGSNGVLIIKPGTTIINKVGFYNKGTVLANGTKDSTITINGSLIDGTGIFHFTYTDFHGSGNFSSFNYKNGDYYFDFCNFNEVVTPGAEYYLFNVNSLHLNNCKLLNCGAYGGLFRIPVDNYYFYKNDFLNCNIASALTWAYDANLNDMGLFKYNNFNKTKVGFSGTNQNTILSINGNINSQNHTYNSFVGFNSTELGAFPLQEEEKSYAFRSKGTSDVCNISNQYWGTSNLQKIKKDDLYDFYENSALPMINVTPFLSAPSDSCHAITWKTLVNGKDPQDEVVDAVGVGKQRFDVYFNRPMDKTVTPQVSFGVRLPYSQQPVNEDGSWSADGRIYTAYKSIKLTTGDGINRIRVAGAKDLEGWEIPVEDMRFEFLVDAATSSSLDFMASAGLGKVKLEWNNNDLADGLGYNMYRMEHINDSTLTKPILINKSLIADTLYTDFAVTPNKKYYYYYKIVRTDLSETDSSRVVSSTPFTASKGDANGDLSVNVLDITTIVSYLLNNSPQPFIFEAADVNSDVTINVLDIVGVVNLVLNGPQKVKGMTMDQMANLYLENDTLFADANVPIGGIQMDISGMSSTADIQTLKALQGFESGYSMKSDTLRLLYYSMSGKSIPAGNHIPLLVMKPANKIVSAVFGGTNGLPIKVNFILTRIPDISNNMNQTVAELGQNFPNPANGKTIIPIRIYEPVDEAVLRIVNMMGQEVKIITLKNPTIGEHLLKWTPSTNKGLFIYSLEVMTANKRSICPNKKMIVQ